MPMHVRRQSPMDLRAAATAPDMSLKDMETFYYTDSQRSDSESEMPATKQSQFKLRTTGLQQRYQSDEELPSPSTEGKDSQEEDNDMDETDEYDLEDLEPLPTITATEIAKAMPLYAGRPTMITIASMAPMARRQTPPTRAPTRPSVNTTTYSASAVPVVLPRRSSLRSKAAYRTVSMYEPPVRTESPKLINLDDSRPINFSAPRRMAISPAGPSPLSAASSPPQLMEPGSPTSSYADSDTSSSVDEGEALIAESNEIQIRTHSMDRDRHSAFGGSDHGEDDILGKPPTPTSYQAYDPYSLEPPTLGRTKVHVTEEPRRWRGLGIARKVRLGRRGRDGEYA